MAKRAIAGLVGGLASGYMMGQKMQADEEERKAREEDRQARREDRQREKDARTAAAETIGRVGTMTTPAASGEDALAAGTTARDQALSGATSDEQRAQVETDYAPTMDALQAQRGTAAKDSAVYTRDQANEDYVRRLQAINPEKAMQVEATQMQLDEGRRKNDKAKAMDKIEKDAGAYMKSRIKMDENGSPLPFTADDFINGAKQHAFKLAEGGHFTEAGDAMRKGFEHQQLKLQAETAERSVAAREAGQRVLNGDFAGALNVFNKFIPDGSNATGATVGKDGSITVTRVSTIDGVKIEPIKFKSAQHFAASVDALADPHAASLYLANSWKQDMEARKVGADEKRADASMVSAGAAATQAKTGVAKEERANTKEDRLLAASSDYQAALDTGDEKAVKKARVAFIAAGGKPEKAEAIKADFTPNPIGMGGTVKQISPDGSVRITPVPVDSKGSIRIPSPAESAAAAPKVGEEKVVQDGPNKGKTAVFDGKGWALKK